ncbi:hypothetical protein [Myroides odoratimimus]|nr:hypothetical protein [Myroides odoratimimus]
MTSATISFRVAFLSLFFTDAVSVVSPLAVALIVVPDRLTILSLYPAH